jgi:hypothetical protein
MPHLFRCLIACSISILHGPLLRDAETVVYKQLPDRELRLIIEEPANWNRSDKQPAIMFFF